MLVPFDPSGFESNGQVAGRHPDNRLVQYLHQQSPEMLAQIAQTVSPEVQQMIAGNIQGLMGVLPSTQFSMQVTTNRDNLAGLLASAMMTGYFLRNIEMRMDLENSFATTAQDE